MTRIFFNLFCMLFVSSCAKTSTSERNATTSADGREERTTDESESIPGYLQEVVIEIENGEAGEGSLDTMSVQAPEGMAEGAYEVRLKTWDLTKIQESVPTIIGEPSVLIKTVEVTRNGFVLPDIDLNLPYSIYESIDIDADSTAELVMTVYKGYPDSPSVHDGMAVDATNQNALVSVSSRIDVKLTRALIIIAPRDAFAEIDIEALTQFVEFADDPEITASDSPAPKLFVTKWKTDNPGESESHQVTLPLVSTGSYDFTVDWGDDHEDIITEYNSTSVTHSYSEPGVYTISIEGEFEGFRFANAGDKEKLLEISAWGDVKLGNEGAYFYGAKYLYISATDTLDLGGTTDLSYAFTNCSQAQSHRGLDQWDVSSVTNMFSMFAGATSFNQDLSEWDVSNVIDMSFMFQGATSFNQDISSWNVGNVQDFEQMFSLATNFNQPIGSWNVSSAESLNAMFFDATSFNQDLSGWNTASVTDFAFVFAGASGFSGDISNWNTANAVTMEQSFARATAFSGAIGGWNTSSVTNMYAMFDRASAFNQDISSWDVSGVTNFAYMFSSAQSFDQNLSSWDISSATSTDYMFFDVTLSTANYDAMLITWNGLTSPPANLSFHGGSSQYSAGAAATARNNLATTYSWTFTDGGQL